MSAHIWWELMCKKPGRDIGTFWKTCHPGTKRSRLRMEWSVIGGHVKVQAQVKGMTEPRKEVEKKKAEKLLNWRVCIRKLSVVWLSVSVSVSMSRTCKELSHIIVPFGRHWDVRWMLQGQMRGWQGAIPEGHTSKCPVSKEGLGSGGIIRERLQTAMFWWPQQSFIKLGRACLNHPVFSTHLDKQKWGILVLFWF